MNDSAPADSDAETSHGEALDAETLAFAARVFAMARHGQAADLAALLDQGLPVDLGNDKGDTLLMLAAYNGNAAVVEELLKRGADPDRSNDRGQVPLAGAAFKGDLPVVALLLAHGARVDGPGRGDERTPLMVAAMFDRVEVAQALLDAGADVGRRDDAGMDLHDLAGKTGAAKVPALLARRRAAGQGSGQAAG